MRPVIARTEQGIANAATASLTYSVDGNKTYTVLVENPDQKAGLTMRTGGAITGSNSAATRAIAAVTQRNKNGCLRFDAVTAGVAADTAFTSALQVDATPGPDVFVDQTAALASAGANDATPFPGTENVNDYFAIGFTTKFNNFKINTGTGGTVGTVAWEYWNGTTWTAVSGLTDGSNGFQTTGTQTISFTMPTDWAARSLNGGANLFYVRARVTGTYTVNPLLTQGFVTAGIPGNNLSLEITAAANQAFSVTDVGNGTYKINLKCSADGTPLQTANDVMVAIANGTTPEIVSFRANIAVSLAEGSDGCAPMALKPGSTTNVITATNFAGGTVASALGATTSIKYGASISGPFSADISSNFANALAQNAAAFFSVVDKPARAIQVNLLGGGTATYVVVSIFQG